MQEDLRTHSCYTRLCTNRGPQNRPHSTIHPFLLMPGSPWLTNYSASAGEGQIKPHGLGLYLIHGFLICELLLSYGMVLAGTRRPYDPVPTWVSKLLLAPLARVSVLLPGPAGRFRHFAAPCREVGRLLDSKIRGTSSTAGAAVLSPLGMARLWCVTQTSRSGLDAVACLLGIYGHL